MLTHESSRIRRSSLLLAAVLAAVSIGISPAVASAETYVVDSSADETDKAPGGGGCESAAGTCTLRAAIEVSNASGGEDRIAFAGTFNGEAGDEIALTLGDLVVEEPLLINGNQDGKGCPTSSGLALRGPCVGVTDGGLDVESSGVTIRGLAVTDAATAISVSGGSKDFVAENDWLGLHLDGSYGRNTNGIFIGPGADGARIEGSNVVERNILVSDGVGLEIESAAGTVFRGSEVNGGTYGIYTHGIAGILGSTIDRSVFLNAGVNGILIENDGNQIYGNLIGGSGQAGVRIHNAGIGLVATGNRIGGDESWSENTISSSGGNGIEIVDESGLTAASQNEVARNNSNANAAGAPNDEAFIDLVGTANGGIQPPSFAAAQSSATGTALAGAKVRVFGKNSADAGELSSFLAETVADAGGNWKVTYPSLPVGAIVAATQTSPEGGTSELAVATTSADPPPCPVGGCPPPCPAGGCPPPAVDETSPQTRITKAPPKKTAKTALVFRFSSGEAESSFQCKLDRMPFKPCVSPRKYKKLKPGKHVFKVRAIDKAGNVDATPAERKFTVLK